MLVDAFDFPDVGVYGGLVEGDLGLCLHDGQFMGLVGAVLPHIKGFGYGRRKQAQSGPD